MKKEHVLKIRRFSNIVVSYTKEEVFDASNIKDSIEQQVLAGKV